MALVLTQPDRPADRGLCLQESPVKRLALRHGLAVFQPPTLKADDAVDRVRAADAQAMVVAAYGLLLPPPVLDGVAVAVNIHASLLPRWRGAAPIQRAILAGDSQTGISIMQMDAGLDTGAVFAREAIPIAAGDDAGTLHDKLAALGAGMVVTTLEEIRNRRARAQPQDGAHATYAAKIRKSETVLDWSESATHLERAVRAFRPSPGARSRLEGHEVKIWGAQAEDARGDPGTVLTASKGIVVACGDGALRITELQRAGGKRVSAEEFVRGRPLTPGIRLGEAS